MLGIRIITLSAAVLSAGLLWSATPDYFPLQVGNSWWYKGGPAIQVTGTEDVGGRTYFVLEAFGRKSLVRTADDGSVVTYNRETGAEEPWLAFGAAEKAAFSTSLDQCTKAGAIESRTEKFSGPYGEFGNVMHIKFELSCADAGITDAWFLPYIGMLRYATTTFAGPRTFDLISSKTGLAEVAAGPVSTRLQLDAASFAPGDTLHARLSVRNTSSKPLTVNFPSAQRYDLAIRDAKGDVVITWSSGKAFAQVYITESIAPGAESNYAIDLQLPGLAPGRYTAESWLTTDSTPPKAYAASVAFDVTEE